MNTGWEIWQGKKPVIGMVHLKALPGSPNGKYELQEIYDAALYDAEALTEGGVSAIEIENQFDVPYFIGDDIGAETVAFLTAAAEKIKTSFPEIPMGIHVLLNGGKQALAIAKAVNAQFIRCYNLMNSYIANSGYVTAAAPELMRYRKNIAAENIMIFGDFQVKHGSHEITADRTLAEKAHDIQTGGAQAAILTGAATGVAPDKDCISDIRKHLDIPLLIGSGLNTENMESIWPYADGAIIGSGFKKDGKLSAPVDRVRVKEFMKHI